MMFIKKRQTPIIVIEKKNQKFMIYNKENNL